MADHTNLTPAEVLRFWRLIFQSISSNFYTDPRNDRREPLRLWANFLGHRLRCPSYVFCPGTRLHDVTMNETLRRGAGWGRLAFSRQGQPRDASFSVCIYTECEEDRARTPRSSFSETLDQSILFLRVSRHPELKNTALKMDTRKLFFYSVLAPVLRNAFADPIPVQPDRRWSSTSTSQISSYSSIWSSTSTSSEEPCETSSSYSSFSTSSVSPTVSHTSSEATTATTSCSLSETSLDTSLTTTLSSSCSSSASYPQTSQTIWDTTSASSPGYTWSPGSDTSSSTSISTTTTGVPSSESCSETSPTTTGDSSSTRHYTWGPGPDPSSETSVTATPSSVYNSWTTISTTSALPTASSARYHPDGSSPGFFCEYPMLPNSQFCNDPDSRDCWLKQGNNQFDIHSDCAPQFCSHEAYTGAQSSLVADYPVQMRTQTWYPPVSFERCVK